MIPWYRRHLRSLHRLLWFAIAAVVVTVIIAAIFGISPDGTTAGQPTSPADTVRNFPSDFVSLLRQIFVMFGGYIPILLVVTLQFPLMYWVMSYGTTYTIRPGEYDVRLSDVRGQPEIVASIEQVMNLFQGHRK